MSPDNLKSGDNDDLEALFDEIAEQRVWDGEPSAEPQAAVSTDIKVQAQASFAAADEEPHDVFRRVGSLTRNLHDALRELGYDKSVEHAVNALPDARARLNYIADLTGKAAEKVLAAVEASQKLNDDVSARAAELDKQWDRLYNNEMSLEEFKSHAHENREFIKEISQYSGQLGGHLTDIMMAKNSWCSCCSTPRHPTSASRLKKHSSMVRPSMQKVVPMCAAIKVRSMTCWKASASNNKQQPG